MSRPSFTRYEIDDRDREEAPDRPWTANAHRVAPSGEEEMLTVEAGIGATPAEALADLHFEDEDEEEVA